MNFCDEAASNFLSQVRHSLAVKHVQSQNVPLGSVGYYRNPPYCLVDDSRSLTYLSHCALASESWPITGRESCLVLYLYRFWKYAYQHRTISTMKRDRKRECKHYELLYKALLRLSFSLVHIREEWNMAIVNQLHLIVGLNTRQGAEPAIGQRKKLAWRGKRAETDWGENSAFSADPSHGGRSDVSWRRPSFERAQQQIPPASRVVVWLISGISQWMLHGPAAAAVQSRMTPPLLHHRCSRRLLILIIFSIGIQRRSCRRSNNTSMQITRVIIIDVLRFVTNNTDNLYSLSDGRQNLIKLNYSN